LNISALSASSMARNSTNANPFSALSVVVTTGSPAAGLIAAPDAIIASLKNAVMASALTGGFTRGMLPTYKRRD
jgi:hypothetical protein